MVVQQTQPSILLLLVDTIVAPVLSARPASRPTEFVRKIVGAKISQTLGTLLHLRRVHEACVSVAPSASGTLIPFAAHQTGEPTIFWIVNTLSAKDNRVFAKKMIFVIIVAFGCTALLVEDTTWFQPAEGKGGAALGFTAQMTSSVALLRLRHVGCRISLEMACVLKKVLIAWSLGCAR